MTAPIIITAKMGKADQAWANGLRRAHYPVERNQIDAHITLFHHLPPNHLPEIRSRLASLASECPPPEAWLTDVKLFGQGVAYRIDSPALLDIRNALATNFQGLLIPQDEARPRLHITIQNKVEQPVAKALHVQLAEDFSPRPIAIVGLAAHYYRSGTWENITTWSFRGK